MAFIFASAWHKEPFRILTWNRHLEKAGYSAFPCSWSSRKISNLGQSLPGVSKDKAHGLDDHDKDITFSGKLRLKDILYALKLADKLGQQTPFGDAARDAFQKLADDGVDELNETKIIDVMRSG